MDKTYNKKQRFLLNLLYIAIIFTLTTLVGKVIGLELTIYNQLIIVIIISTIIKSFTKYPILIFLILIIGFLIMLFINIYKFPIFLFIANRVILLFSNLMMNLQNGIPILKENIIIMYFIIITATSVYTAIIIYRMKNIFLLIPIYLFVFLTYWYSFIDEAYNFTAIFLFLFFILLGFKGYKKSKLNSNKVFGRWIRIAIVYSILIVSISFLIPKSNDYISWPWLQEKVYNLFPIVEDLRYYKDYNRKTANAELFNFSTSGFSDKNENSELGGPLVQSERKVMIVETDEPLYLRGNTKHLYTGESWINMSYEFSEHNSKQDFSELLDTQRNRAYKEDQITITFDSFTSKTIFTPYKTISINLNRNSPIVVDNDVIITSQNGIYKDEGYIVTFLKPLPYEALISNRVNQKKSDLLDLDFYLDSAKEVITDRTKNLTKSLVEGIEDDYTKAITIQNYLRDNYKYNLDVPPLPDDAEFVDHFLFEQREGYCTYYATSMAVMLRLENIPTRYVEGYIVDEKIDENKYQVRQKHAHAWVEAFIEPVGWMTFEPTAAYDPLEKIEKDEEEIKPDIAEDLTPEKDDTPKKPREEIDTPIEDDAIVVDTNVNKIKVLWKIIILSSIPSILLFIIIKILWRFSKYRSKEKYLTSLSNKAKIIYLYKDILDILSILGYPMKNGETHFDYSDRIYKLKDSKDHRIKDITGIFVKLKYSDIEAKDKNVLSLLKYKYELDSTLKDTLGKTNYLYRKYINIYFKKRKEIP